MISASVSPELVPSPDSQPLGVGQQGIDSRQLRFEWSDDSVTYLTDLTSGRSDECCHTKYEIRNEEYEEGAWKRGRLIDPLKHFISTFRRYE